MTQHPATGAGVVDDLITAQLLHRFPPGARGWWRSAVVWRPPHDLLGTSPQLADIAAASEWVSQAAGLGVQAVTLSCPPLPTEAEVEVITAIQHLLDHAGSLGLRIMLRLDADDPRDEASARYWLARGADGIDVGELHDGEPSHERFRQLQALLAGYGHDEDAALAGHLHSPHPQQVSESLHEDWLHHLVDDGLAEVSDATVGAEVVTRAYRAREPLGAPGAWLAPSSSHTELGLARLLLVLALPGAVYLPTPARQQFPSLLGEALRLRTEHGLGVAALALVRHSGDQVANSGLFVLSGEVLVACNVGSEPLSIRQAASLLLSSGQTTTNENGHIVVAPQTTSWLHIAPARPQRDPRARR